jgi:hypothetical protein
MSQDNLDDAYEALNRMGYSDLAEWVEKLYNDNQATLRVYSTLRKESDILIESIGRLALLCSPPIPTEPEQLLAGDDEGCAD